MQLIVCNHSVHSRATPTRAPQKQEQTHKHRHPHYAIGKNVVKFNGRIIKGASASSFKILRDGYAKDAWGCIF